MSRSIHTTRRHLEELRREEYADAKYKEDRRKRLEEELEAKRLIKEMSRQASPSPTAGHASPDAVPIRVEKEPSLFHPATPEDIREVLRRMPEGLLDGLTGITLCFGKEYLKRTEANEPWCEHGVDPVTGRPGLEVMPGIYAASAFGVYSPSKGGIWLPGYALSPKAKRTVAVDMHLRLRTLNVLMHELAHHDDWMRRTARGRWCGVSQHNEERYAENTGYQWTRLYVIPYLRQRYPTETKELQDFIRMHTGIDLPLDLLAGDQRGHSKGDRIRVAGMLPLDRGVDALFTKVQAGVDALEIRLDLAWDLHAAEHYAEAIQIVDDLLASEPNCREALLHKSHINCDQDRFTEAAGAARQVMASDPDDIDAIEGLADAYEGLKDWPAVVELCTRALSSSTDNSHSFRRGFLGRRARARINLGDLDSAKADIAEIRAFGDRYSGRYAKRLEQLLAERSQPRVDPGGS